jgi:hypothetical protein
VRVGLLQKELDLEYNGTGAPDTQNMMMLIQGTVMPQVRTVSYCYCIFHSISIGIMSTLKYYITIELADMTIITLTILYQTLAISSAGERWGRGGSESVPFP